MLLLVLLELQLLQIEEITLPGHHLRHIKIARKSRRVNFVFGGGLRALIELARHFLGAGDVFFKLESSLLGLVYTSPAHRRVAQVVLHADGVLDEVVATHVFVAHFSTGESGLTRNKRVEVCAVVRFKHPVQLVAQDVWVALLSLRLNYFGLYLDQFWRRFPSTALRCRMALFLKRRLAE